MTDLFEPLIMGANTLKNRIIMAPLTRMRAQQPGNVPYALNAEYYAQRAGAGLIITEATQVSQQGQGYPGTPGIHTPQQVEGWKLITKAVQEQGSKIFAQLWHVGRISHSSHQIGGALPVAPSAIKPSGMVFTADWQQAPYETPHALELSEIPGIIADFKHGAQCAKDAGFDGVEVHGANGYLLDQFLQTSANTRTDSYGGSIENRARLLLEVVDATISVWGKDRVGVRLSPYGTFNDMADENPNALFTYVLEQLSARGIAYVHMIEPRATSAGGNDAVAQDAPSTSELFRAHFKGVFLSAGGYTPELAKTAVETGTADAVVFGRYYISNPDLAQRIQAGIALAPYNRATFYGGAQKGYTDYPKAG